jgi:hypothetical protein
VHTGEVHGRPFVGRAAAQTIIPHFPFYGIINYCTHQINTYSNIFNDGASPFSGWEIIYEETQTLLPRALFLIRLCAGGSVCGKSDFLAASAGRGHELKGMTSYWTAHIALWPSA